MIHEKDFEDIISKYPEIIEEGLTLKGRQLTLYGRRIDLLFEDKFKRSLIIELKIGPIKDQHIGQVLSYEGMLLSSDDPTIRVMLVGNRVPPNIQRSLDHHGIAWTEISFSTLKQFLSEKNDEFFLKLLDEEELPNSKKTESFHSKPLYKSTEELVASLKSSENYISFKSILKQKTDNEDKAKTILIENLGNLNHDQIDRIIALIDEPYQYYKNGKIHNGPWFGRLLQSNIGNLFSIDLVKLNNWFNIVSNTYLPPDKKIELLLDHPNNISGLNVGFITLMMYILDKDRYSIWFEVLHNGLKHIHPEIGIFVPKSKQYLVFNDTAKEFAKKYCFEPSELDWIFGTGLPEMCELTEKNDLRNSASINISELRKLQKEYWEGLKSYMETQGSFVKIRTAYPKSWSDISLGMTDIYLAAGINSRENVLNIWLVIRGEQGKHNFDKLNRIAYENSLIEISQDLKWDRMEGRKSCAVKLNRFAYFRNKDDWENQFEWFKKYIEKYVNFFKPLIKKI